MKWFPALLRKQSPRERAIINFVSDTFAYQTKAIELFKQALRHRSAATKNGEGLKNSNERLEFLGDSVLDMVIAEYLYKEFPDTTEGQLTKMKAKVVSRRTLNKLAQNIGLEKVMELKMGKQDLHPSIIGNAFEAIIGAVYLERGFNFTKQSVVNLMRSHGLEDLVHAVVDFKSKLHEWCQKEKKTLAFQVVNESQSGGEPHFDIAVRVDNVQLGLGKGRSKKVAEQLAAEQACKLIFNH